MFSSGYLERMVGKVVSFHGAVISSVTEFDSPEIFLKEIPYLRMERNKGINFPFLYNAMVSELDGIQYH